jgi:1-phosphofructokinase family hexose kinase
VIIAGPNLTLDRMLRIDELRPGEVLRFSEATIAPGGKGVNVARVCRTLGFPAVLVALAPGRTGRAVVELLQDEGVELDAVPTGGEARAASIVLERSGRVTVLNEPGPTIGGEDWRAFEAAVAVRLSGHRFLVCIGSTPPGSPSDAYGRLVRLARERGVSSLVDASGESLANALEAGPELVTPNLAEAAALAGARPEDDPEALARAVHALGPGAVVVTGGHRAEATDVFFDGGRIELIEGDRQPDGATHGSGCTHSSTLAAELAKGAPPLEAARTAKRVAEAAVRDGLRDLGEGAGPVDVFGLGRRARTHAAGAPDPRPDGRRVT